MGPGEAKTLEAGVLCRLERARSRMRSSPLSSPSLSSRGSLLSSLWLCLPPCSVFIAVVDSEVVRSGPTPLPTLMQFPSLPPAPNPIYIVSLKSLLEMKAMALPLLASHPPFPLLQKQIDKIKLVAIQANTGDLAIVADTCAY